jgi:hypothetical protein
MIERLTPNLKVYLAGGDFWDNEQNWRFDIVDGLSRYKEPGSDCEEFEDYDCWEDVTFDWPVKQNVILGCMDYVGPYPGHGGLDKGIKQGIQQADFIFAWADNLLPAEIGRLSAELGYAAALKKRVVLIGSTIESNTSLLEVWVGVHLGAFIDSPFLAPNSKDAFLKAFKWGFQFLPVDKQVNFYLNNKGRKLGVYEGLERSGYVYLIKAETGEYKIGRTINIPNRMKLFAVKLPFDFEIIHYFPCLDAPISESLLHRLYDPQRKRGEWFNLTEKDVEAIKRVKYFSDTDFIDNNEMGVFSDHPRSSEVWDSFGF